MVVSGMSLERVFLGTDRPALAESADFLVSRFGVGDELDLSGVVVVVPGQRARRRLLELLVQRHGERFPGLRPPVIETFEQFPERLYPVQRPPAPELTQLLVWMSALYAVPAERLRAAIPHRPSMQSVPAWLALCQSLRRQHSDLAAELHSFAGVAQHLQGAGEIEEAARWRALAEVQDEYHRQLDGLQLWDVQTARRVAVERGECRSERAIVLVGIAEMSTVIRQMLAQCRTQCVALIPADNSLSDDYDDYGCVLADRWDSRLLNIPAGASRITGSPAELSQAVVAEVRAVAAHLRADDITIGVADEALVPLLQQALADAGLRGNPATGRPLKRTRPWRLLESVSLHLASARDQLPPDFPSLRDLIRHPDLAAWLDVRIADRASVDGGWLEAVDSYTSEHLQMTPGVMLGSGLVPTVTAEVCRGVEELLRCLLPSGEQSESAISAVGRIHPDGSIPARQKTLDELFSAAESMLWYQLLQPRPMTVWAEGLVRLLAQVYGGRQYSAQSDADVGICRCVEALQDVCDELRRLPAVAVPTCSAAMALDFFLARVADERLSAVWHEDGIDLPGWLDLALDDAPFLVVAGFNEGNVPAARSQDGFLPDSLRAVLNLSDSRRRCARDASFVWQLLHSRRRVIFVLGRRDQDGNPLIPSRLWFACDAEEIPLRVRQFFAESDEGGDSAELLRDGAATGGFVIPAPANVPEVPDVIGVSSFRDYLNCPYRYFLQRELFLGNVADDVRELDAAAFGRLMHEVLNGFGTSPLKDSADAAAIAELLRHELQRQALTRFGRSRSATVSVQLKILETRLEVFAERQAETVREGWRILYTEQELVDTEFTDVRGRKVAIKGRVDRIDRHIQTGVVRILDYKTSEQANKPDQTHRSQDQWIDLQLPLYRRLVRGLGLTGTVQLGYVQLPGDTKKIGFELAEWSDAELESAEQLASVVAADLLDLKITAVESDGNYGATALSGICQDSVIDRRAPWLKTWRGRPQSGQPRDEATSGL